jgi:hypothetical protein
MVADRKTMVADRKMMVADRKMMVADKKMTEANTPLVSYLQPQCQKRAAYLCLQTRTVLCLTQSSKKSSIRQNKLPKKLYMMF